MKHKVTINVLNGHGPTSVLKGAQRRLPTRLIRLLFGDFTQIYMFAPGKTVESVDIKEIKEE